MEEEILKAVREDISTSWEWFKTHCVGFRVKPTFEGFMDVVYTRHGSSFDEVKEWAMTQPPLPEVTS